MCPCRAHKTKKPLEIFEWFSFAWRCPTLPGVFTPSTIGAGGLNGRVRDGNEWIPSAIVTRQYSVEGTHLQNANGNEEDEEEYMV